MNNDPADLLTLLVALLTYVTGREVANLLGPYAAIFLVACSGSGLSLAMNKETMGALRAAWYVAIRVLVAAVLTVAVAEFFQLAIPWAKPRYTFIPLAFCIGFIRDKEHLKELWQGFKEFMSWRQGENGK